MKEDLLEYRTLKGYIRPHIVSEMGLSSLEALQPFAAWETARERAAMVDEMMNLLSNGADTRVVSVPDIRPLLALRAGAVLEGSDIVAISGALRAMKRTREALNGSERLGLLAERMHDLAFVSGEIDALLLPTGEVSERAAPALGQLRKKALGARARILDKMNALLERLKRAGVVMDDLVTQRNERYVLPLRLDFATQIKGITHDYSRTHQTAFVEPMELVDDNNELQQLRYEIREEETRVLRELSQLVHDQAADIRSNLAVYATVDLIHACARWGIGAGCNIIATDGLDFSLRQARHPILIERLGREQVVALDIHIPHGKRCLVISGPNAGGKTVALKTLGLIVDMARSGLPVPADPSSNIPPVGRVWVEMDPGQDIGQDLSSFTSHALALKQIYEQVAPGDLVLLDEPGSGTDYEQGGAVAVACIEGLRSRGVYVALTSHSHLIKLFALSSAEVEYAATAYDEQLLRPGYSLEYGMIGRSHAFEILQTIAFPPELLQEAHAILSGEGASPLMRAMDDIAQTQALRQQAEKELAEAARLREIAAQEAAQMQRERSETALRFGQVMQKLERMSLRPQPQQSLAEVRQAPEVRELATVLAATGAAQDLAIRAGALVRIKGSSSTGRVIALKGDTAELRCGAKRLRVGLANLEGVAESPTPRGTPQNRVVVPAVEYVLPIKVVGLRVDDALPLVERALDRAVLSGQESLEIIHGAGSGTLKKAIRRRLRDLPGVATLGDAALDAGGAGKTIVRLQSNG